MDLKTIQDGVIGKYNLGCVVEVSLKLCNEEGALPDIHRMSYGDPSAYLE